MRNFDAVATEFVVTGDEVICSVIMVVVDVTMLMPSLIKVEVIFRLFVRTSGSL